MWIQIHIDKLLVLRDLRPGSLVLPRLWFGIWKVFFSLPGMSILIDRQDFDRNFLNIYEGTQVEEVRICAKWVFNGTCGLNQAGEYLTWSRLLVSRDKRKKASEKKG